MTTSLLYEKDENKRACAVKKDRYRLSRLYPINNRIYIILTVPKIDKVIIFAW